MTDVETPTESVVLHGEFVRQNTWGEPSATLFGEGSITATDEGLHLVAMHNQAKRRVRIVLLTLVAVCVGGGAVCAYFGAVPGVLTMLACGVAAVVAVRLWCQPVRFDQVVPWSEVDRPGVSDSMLVFGLKNPYPGIARFRVPGWGLKELRPVAQTLTRRGRRG
jgi:hypothetical protein